LRVTPLVQNFFSASPTRKQTRALLAGPSFCSPSFTQSVSPAVGATTTWDEMPQVFPPLADRSSQPEHFFPAWTLFR
jgi:hypothetical protein